MATTEELEKEILAEMAADPVAYAAGPVNDVITIDGETRMISVPASEIFFGVESDKDVERKHFRCPKVVGDGIDLSKHQIYISYITSDSAGKTFSGNAGLYLCEDVATDGDDITFSWQLSGNVFASAGFIAFKVLAAKTDGENVQTRWNTVPAIGTVLMTVPDGMDIGEAYPDIVTQLLERMASVEKIATEEAMQGYVNTYLEAHPGEIDETLTDPKKAAPASVVGELKGDLVKFNPLFSYVAVGVKVLSGVKNRFDIENIADTGFHISINVKSGEKYIINGSGFNDNYPLYVICSDNAIIEYSDDTTYSYKNGVEVKIPNGATKLYVNGKYEYQPLIKKLVYDNHKKTIDEKSYDIPLNVEHLIYHNEIENLTNDTGYSALIPVVEGDKYFLSGSGTGQFSSYIFYDKNMSIVSFGESSVIVDKLVIIPNNVVYLRIQNNLEPLLKAIKYIERNIIFIGDSYTQGNSLGNDKDKRFSTVLSKMLRMKEINVGTGGCGYFKTENHPTHFYQQLIDAIDSMSAKDWANTEYIIVCGGRNDTNNYPNATQAEYDKAISDICDMTSKYFPCAKLVFVPYLFDSNYMLNNCYKHFLKLVNALRKNKCVVINYAYTWLTGRFADILEDKVHPNVNGHNIIAHNLYNVLMGGNIINNQSVRLMGASEYTPEWTYIDCMLLGIDTLNIFGNFTISENVPAQTIILEHTFEENDIYTAYTGRTSFSLLISNLSTGISYSVFLKYENGKIRLYANTTIPKGNYFISYTMPFGRL